MITDGYWHELGDGLVTDACLLCKEPGVVYVRAGR